MDDVPPPAPLPVRLYRFAVEHGARWPLGKAKLATPVGPPRVGYYVWRFPDLTGTYIYREVGALRQAGLDVEVFADVCERHELLDAEARRFAADTRYLLPIDAERLRAYQQRLRRRDRFGYLNAFAYTALHRYGIHKRPSEDLRVFRHALYLAGHVLEHGITHLHSPWANLSAFIAMLAARVAGVTYSVQARASADLYRDRSRSGLGEIFAHATFIVTSSEFNRAFIEQAVGARLSVPIEVIYEGLDVARFAPAPRRVASGEPLRILSVGRLSEEKGFEHLLQALALLRERGRAFRCVIVGGAEKPGDHDRALVELCGRLGLGDAVSFTGAVPFGRVLQEYGQADVFVMASVIARDGGRDVTPNALIEAMAMRLPVVATRITAIPEIVEDRVSGILVPPRNPLALAQALLELADDAGLAHALGVNARRRVEERFDIRKSTRRYLERFAGSGTSGRTPLQPGTTGERREGGAPSAPDSPGATDRRRDRRGASQ
jgi:colanic acid/amylovoran biosynthesis glycosyltransferase